MSDSASDNQLDVSKSIDLSINRLIVPALIIISILEYEHCRFIEAGVSVERLFLLSKGTVILFVLPVRNITSTLLPVSSSLFSSGLMNTVLKIK